MGIKTTDNAFHLKRNPNTPHGTFDCEWLDVLAIRPTGFLQFVDGSWVLAVEDAWDIRRPDGCIMTCCALNYADSLESATDSGYEYYIAEKDASE